MAATHSGCHPSDLLEKVESRTVEYLKWMAFLGSHLWSSKVLWEYFFQQCRI
jgi:hypothetical protein